MSRGKEHLPVDLHLHSTASDGSLTPTQLIARAAELGLAGVALTDHDTLEGIDEALAAGRSHGLEVLPGVELSASDGENKIHLLGYDPLFPEKISAVLEERRRERYRRMEKMLLRLHSLGFHIGSEEVAAEAGGAAPGRLHLARVMVRRGFVPTVEKAFSLYLAQGRPAYVPRNGLDPAKAIALLHRAGAVPVVAHPGASGRKFIRQLVALGLRGIEVYHPDHNPEMVRYYRLLAQKLGLLVTGGSDYHGDRDYRAGSLGSITVPYICLVAIKKTPRGASIYSPQTGQNEMWE